MQDFNIFIGNLTSLWRTRPAIVLILWHIRFDDFTTLYLLHQNVCPVICKSIYRFYQGRIKVRNDLLRWADTSLWMKVERKALTWTLSIYWLIKTRLAWMFLEKYFGWFLIFLGRISIFKIVNFLLMTFDSASAFKLLDKLFVIKIVDLFLA